MSINWQLDVTPPPAILVLPPAAASLDEAHAAIELWEHYSRKKLDPTQRLTVEVMMAQRTDGRWAAQTTGREMPRQNGKGDEVEVPELWGLVQRSEAILHTIHDAVLLATQTQERMLSVLEGHPDLRKKIKRKWTGTGQQMIEMRNGGIIWYRTRTGGGGRGVDDIDRLVIDEAQHATDEQLAAMTPTLFVNKNPQMNIIGTAGLEGRSDWWWKIRKRALVGGDAAFGYVGHTAERVSIDPNGRIEQRLPDVTDRKVWIESNPALAAGRGRGMEILEEQFANLGPEMFAQEHLCVWSPPGENGVDASIIPLVQWDALEADCSDIVSGETFALDISPDRHWASFAVAGRCADGVSVVEVFDRRPGTSWVVERAIKLYKDHKKPIRLEKGGPAGSFVTQLAEARVEVVEVSTADHARATGQFIDAALSGGLRHLGDPVLRSAIVGATLRHSGDADLWARRSSKVDISPLVACTLALGGVPESGESNRPVFAA